MQSLLVFIAFVAPVLIVGALSLRHESGLVHRSLWTPAARVHRTLVAESGSIVATIVIGCAGAGAIVATIWPLGVLASRAHALLDAPLYDWWVASQSGPDDAWTQFNLVATKMGDPVQSLTATALASVIFAALWRRHRWWVPPLVLFATLGIEWFLQMLLGDVIGRAPPPTGTGTFPSGGSARVVAIFGMVFYLMLLTWPAASRRLRVLGWTVVALLGAVEGYSRLYLLRHWTTDVPGGWLFGFLLLLAMAGCTLALLAPDSSRPVSADLAHPSA